MNRRIQLLDDLGAEFARVAVDTEARGQRGSLLRRRAVPARARARTLAVTVAITVLLAGSAFALPATRDAVGGAVGSLTGWVRGDDGELPGRALARGDDAPPWFDQRSGDARVIAEAGGVGLFVRRSGDEGDRMLEFGIGRGMIVGDSLEGWRERLGERPLVVLPGPAAFGPRDLLDDRGRFALIGVTTRAVTRLEVRYADGGSLVRANGDGGFVLLVDAWRPLRELVAYDRAGGVVARADLHGYDMHRLCEREPGCPGAGGRR